MHTRLIRRAAIAIASLLAVASPSYSAEWTSLKIGTLTGFAFSYDHLPDGRYVFGINGKVMTQNAFGTLAATEIANAAKVVFDPSFVAIGSATQGLIGAGGFGGPSGLFAFDPSQPAMGISNTALIQLQNYSAIFWRHPLSGLQGWLIVGGNGTGGASNITFVSTDGSKSGPITADLSSYSGGVAADSQGNVFTVLADMSPAESEKVLKFDADQINTAVQAVINNAPTPLPKASAQIIFKADASGSLAVDAQGHIWVGGFQINWLQCFDPTLAISRRFLPDHPKLKNADGGPTYQAQTFARGNVDYVSFLANDSFYTSGSDLQLGYKPVSEIEVRTVTMDVAAQTVSETSGEISVTVNVTPVPIRKINIPLNFSGTASRSKDFVSVVGNLPIFPGEPSKTFKIKVLNDTVDEDNNNETVVVKLGNPTPVAHAGLGALGSDTFTLTITDDDFKPLITSTQTFANAKVGSNYNQAVLTTGGVAVKWSAKGLPPGLKIDAATGIITGRPTAAGEYDQVVITATNTAGQSTSIGYQIIADDFSPFAKGNFAGIIAPSAADTANLGGRLDLKVMPNASFSGKVTIGRRSIPISGILDTSATDPTATVPVGFSSPAQTLSFEIDPATGLLTGTLSGGATLTGQQLLAATALTGPHHFSLDIPGAPSPSVPEGTGFGSISVLANASVTVSGKAADGSSFTSSTFLGTGGEVAVYQPLYNFTGSLIGILDVANDAPHTVSGTLTWSKPTPTTGPLYNTGWAVPLSLTAQGGKYRPASGTMVALGLPPGTNSVDLILQGGGLDTISPNPSTINFFLATPAVTIMPTGQKLTINNTKGTFSGSVTLGNAPARKTFTIQGLLVPNTSTPEVFDAKGHGYFLLPVSPTVTRSGAVLIESN